MKYMLRKQPKGTERPDINHSELPYCYENTDKKNSNYCINQKCKIRYNCGFYEEANDQTINK